MRPATFEGWRSARLIGIVICAFFAIEQGFAAEVMPEKEEHAEVEEASGPDRGKAGFETDQPLESASSTLAQLFEDDALKDSIFRFPEIESAFEPWFDWKTEINELYGLQIGAAYTTTSQWSNDALEGSPDSASSGIAKVFGQWKLVGRGTPNIGSLVFGVDYRHRIGDLAPADFAGSLGYNGITALLYTDVGGMLMDLHWRQWMNDGKTGVILGRYDPNDYLDVLGYVNPYSTFQNLSVLVNTSIALPDLGTGVGVSHWFDDNWNVKASVSDVNGVATDVQFFEDFGERYTSAELSWSPARAARLYRNIHITYWHADERMKAGIPQDEGITLGANWTTSDGKWMSFARAGWSGGKASIYKESYTLGIMRKLRRNGDLMGLGVNWGEPDDETLSSQTTVEVFYRAQFSQGIALTPNVQWLVNPSFRDDGKNAVVFGLRFRVSL